MSATMSSPDRNGDPAAEQSVTPANGTLVLLAPGGPPSAAAETAPAPG